jgi:hypothetical protein
MIRPGFHVRLPREKGCAASGGLDRRSFLSLGVGAAVGAGAFNQLARAGTTGGASGSSKRVILFWLDGGPSHMDLYDMKPDAPAEYRGIWKPIRTTVPGMDITELFPRQASVAHHFSLIRSLHHGTGDHFSGGHRILTGKDLGVSGANTAPKFPSLGSIVARECGSRAPGMPAYVGLPNASSIGLVPGYFGGHFLGKALDPFMPGGDPNQPGYSVRNLDLAQGLTMPQLDDRRTLRHRFDTMSRALDELPLKRTMDGFDGQALEFLQRRAALEAFRIDQEESRLRDRYGRNSWGQSALLARRLVEAGSTFVTLTYGGWDHHWDLKKGMENYLPMVDAAVATLIEDLHARGLLEETLVLVMGEFSRTPKMNDGGNGGAPGSMGTPGRDHWGNAMSILVAGGGTKPGLVVGETEKLGQSPKSRPITPRELHATVYKVLGIDPNLMLIDPTGRPTSPLEQAQPIHEII